MKNILITIDTSRASGRRFLAGVQKYTVLFADWQLFLRPPIYLTEFDSHTDLGFRLDEIDGIIARDAYDIPDLQAVDKPKVINDTQREWIAGCSTIVTDSKAIGKMAADYLFGLGFTHFAYCGFTGLSWSQKRFFSFKQRLAKKGISTFSTYPEGLSGKIQRLAERLKLSDWLIQLPRPVCVFACNDDCAVYVLEACRIAGLNVPEEIAVLGVDNDELVCNLPRSTLSSIELDFESAGFQAAEHLNALIHRQSAQHIITVRPREVVKRNSTDVLAVSDADVVSALIYIRNNFKSPIQVPDVVGATLLSRRELEKRFKKILKSTIKNEIEKLRIEHVKKMLLHKREPVYRVISELKFIDQEHFSRYFKDATGQTPLQFRRNNVF